MGAQSSALRSNRAAEDRRGGFQPLEASLSEAHARSIHAREVALRVVDELVRGLAEPPPGEGTAESAEDRELALAVAMIWLPQTASRLGEVWARRCPVSTDSPAVKARRLLVERRLGQVSREDFYTSTGILLRSLEAKGQDPVLLTAVLHAFLLAVRHRRLALDDLPESDLRQAKRFIGVLQGQLYSGGYRRGSRYCSSPELVLCMISEMWRDTVPLGFALRPALEQAVRWELQVEVAETPLSRAALTIAAENLHLEGVDPRQQRLELLDLQDEFGGFRPMAVRRYDGTVFSAARLLNLVFVARALGGQPRTGSRRVPPS